MHVDWVFGHREAGESVTQVGPVSIWIAVLGILEEVVWGQTKANPLVSNCVADGLDNLEHESTPVLHRAAIVIRTRINVVMEKLVQEVSICTFFKLVRHSHGSQQRCSRERPE